MAFLKVLLFQDLKSHLRASGVDIDAKVTEKSVVVEDDPISIMRREKVKRALLHAWTSYEKYAWGKDELEVFDTKLAAENYLFFAGQDKSVGTSWNILRPETVESLFYLCCYTVNKTYQDWAWNIFQAFESNSRLETGYVGLKDVTTGDKDNMMQSFFLSGTLKYLYLLFSPPSVIPLDEWVFNTEAHPLRIVTRSSQEESIQADGDQKLRFAS